MAAVRRVWQELLLPFSRRRIRRERGTIKRTVLHFGACHFYSVWEEIGREPPEEQQGHGTIDDGEIR